MLECGRYPFLNRWHIQTRPQWRVSVEQVRTPMLSSSYVFKTQPDRYSKIVIGWPLGNPGEDGKLHVSTVTIIDPRGCTGFGYSRLAEPEIDYCVVHRRGPYEVRTLTMDCRGSRRKYRTNILKYLNIIFSQTILKECTMTHRILCFSIRVMLAVH